MEEEYLDFHPEFVAACRWNSDARDYCKRELDITAQVGAMIAYGGFQNRILEACDESRWAYEEIRDSAILDSPEIRKIPFVVDGKVTEIVERRRAISRGKLESIDLVLNKWRQAEQQVVDDGPLVVIVDVLEGPYDPSVQKVFTEDYYAVEYIFGVRLWSENGHVTVDHRIGEGITLRELDPTEAHPQAWELTMIHRWYLWTPEEEDAAFAAARQELLENEIRRRGSKK